MWDRGCRTKDLEQWSYYVIMNMCPIWLMQPWDMNAKAIFKENLNKIRRDSRQIKKDNIKEWTSLKSQPNQVWQNWEVSSKMTVGRVRWRHLDSNVYLQYIILWNKRSTRACVCRILWRPLDVNTLREYISVYLIQMLNSWTFYKDKT